MNFRYRWLWRTLVGIPLLAGVTLFIEVQIAIHGTRLPTRPPFDLDRHPASANTRVLWLGDSTAAGVGASGPQDALPFQVTTRTAGAAAERVDITARAISGARVSQVVQSQLMGLGSQSFDDIYISVGANDTTHLTSRSTFERSYEAMLDALPSHRRLVLLGVPDMGSPLRFPQPLRSIVGLRGTQIDGVIQRIASDRGATYVAIRQRTGSLFRAEPQRYFAADRFHPSDAGYGLWADAVRDATFQIDR